MPYSARLDAMLDELLRQDGADALTWCVRPILAECVAQHRVPLRRRAAVAGAHLGAVRPSRSPHGVRRIADIAVIADTVNHRRVLDPLVDALSARSGSAPTQAPARIDVRVYKSATARAWSLSRRVSTAAEDARLPIDSAEVLRRALGAARALARARRFFEAPPKAVVVASQAAPHVRAFLWESRRLRIPTVYVPHAPLARTRAYEDLPVDFGALRGDAEVAWYRDLGVHEGLRAVGNPAMTELNRPDIDPQGPAVLAVSPQDEPQLRGVIAMANVATSAIGARVLVAPHPRQDMAQLRRVCPPSWSIAERGSTPSLLTAGPWCVMQSSSGVAWEALALGLPTVQLSPRGEEPAYPLIAPPAVPIATDASTAIAALRDARKAATNPMRRDELAAHARAWCATVGGQATAALMTFVDHAVDEGPRSQQLANSWWRNDPR